MRGFWKAVFGVSADDLAGTDGWSLRFTGVPENLWWLFGLVALFAILSLLTVRSYRREGQWPPRVKMAVAAVRLAVLALLFAVVLQPALVMRFVREESSAVIVLVDDTASMQWRDRYADAKQRTALAGLLGVPDERLGGEPGVTRTEAVSRALARSGGLIERLAGDHPVHVYRFGVSAKDSSDYVEPVVSLEKAGRREAGKTGGAPDVPGTLRERLSGLKGEGHYTDPARALREVLNRLEGRRVAAAVIVSDGQCTDAARQRGRLAGAVEMAAQRGIPVYTVGVGDPTPPPNVAVTKLQGPREARTGSTLAFTAFVTRRSLPETTVEVRLFRAASAEGPWEDTGVSAPLTLGADAPGAAGSGDAGAGGERLFEAVLAARAPDVGVYVYKARIEPLPGEAVLRDNEAWTTVRVTDRKMNVLLISGDAGWEFQYLRNFLLRQPDHFAVSAWQQNADARFNQDASLGMARATLPRTRDELMAFDVVILCDPRHAPDSFDASFVGLLDAFVGKHDGGLCYIAGRKYTQKNLTDGGPFPALAGLLPVVLAPALGRPADSPEAVPVVLTAEGRETPMLQLAEGAEANQDVWRRLPGIFWSQNVARPKSLARVLAVKASRDGAAPAGEGEPLLATQHYGRGRVLYIGFNALWRWSRLDDARHYRRFWTHAMNFLGAGRLEKKRILVTTGSECYEAGSEIEVRVEAATRDYDPLDAKALVLEMRPVGGGAAATCPLRRERPGAFRGLIRADRVGTFELDVTRDDAGQADWVAEDVAVRRISVLLPQAEFKRPEADFAALRALAGDPDRFVPLPAIDTLAGKIPRGKTAAVTEVPLTLWDTLFMLGLVGGLLLSEWTLRKVFHMM
jgi:hypothetical protein